MHIPSLRKTALPLLLALAIGFFGMACGSGDAPSEEEQAEQTEEVAMQEGERVTPPDEMDDDRSVKRRVEDATIAARVRQALGSERSLRVYNFQTESAGGNVTIRGDVSSRSDHDRVTSIAEDVSGVQGVSNEVTVDGEAVVDESDQAIADAATDEDDDTTEEDSEPASAEYHTVQSGESLWIIARSYGTSVDRIQQLNDMTGSSVQPGDRIRVQ